MKSKIVFPPSDWFLEANMKWENVLVSQLFGFTALTGSHGSCWFPLRIQKAGLFSFAR